MSDIHFFHFRKLIYANIRYNKNVNTIAISFSCLLKDLKILENYADPLTNRI